MIKQLVLPLLLLAGLYVRAAGPETTIIFVNPAESETSPVPDPGLSAGGREQAAALQNALAGTAVSVIYSTYSNCAVQTVEPLAKERGMELNYYRATEDAGILQSVMEDILKKHKGKTVVVCAPPRVIPVMARFAGIRPRDMKGSYDKGNGRGWVVKIPDQGQAIAQKLNMNIQKKV